MRVLLTGGSGFIAAHCLDVLTKRGYDIVTTVRSKAKGAFITSKYPSSKISIAIVEDIARPDAFEETVKQFSPLDAVIHTASPFHYNVKDNKKDMLDPAVIGTTSILKALKAHGGSSCKRVVITSSFAAMTNPASPPKVYDESVWNLMTWEEAVETTNPQVAYRGSKKFAESSAWDFIKDEQPLSFQLTVLNPPFVFGPIAHDLKSLDSINTSNKRMLNIVEGKKHEGPIGSSLYVDVRDLAEAHVRAIEPAYPDAAGKRVFMTPGGFSDLNIAEIIREKFPQLKDRIGDDLLENLKEKSKPMSFDIDNSRSKEVLKMRYLPFEKTVVDTVQSLLDHGA